MLRGRRRQAPAQAMRARGTSMQAACFHQAAPATQVCRSRSRKRAAAPRQRGTHVLHGNGAAATARRPPASQPQRLTACGVTLPPVQLQGQRMPASALHLLGRVLAAMLVGRQQDRRACTTPNGQGARMPQQQQQQQQQRSPHHRHWPLAPEGCRVLALPTPRSTSATPFTRRRRSRQQLLDSSPTASVVRDGSKPSTGGATISTPTLSASRAAMATPARRLHRQRLLVARTCPGNHTTPLGLGTPANRSGRWTTLG